MPAPGWPCSSLHYNPSTTRWRKHESSLHRGGTVKSSVSECTSTAGAWMKTHARADCIALHCTWEKKRHFRLLRNFACQSSILWVTIYTFRNYMSLLKNPWGLHILHLQRCLDICVLPVNYLCLSISVTVLKHYPSLWILCLLFSSNSAKRGSHQKFLVQS